MNQQMDGLTDLKSTTEFNLNDNTTKNRMQMTLELNAFSVGDDPSMSYISFQITSDL